jgi:hypothetical protein
MRRTTTFILQLAALLWLTHGPARADMRSVTVWPGMLCRQAIQAAERTQAIPDSLLAAIGRVESGRPDASGTYHPWPWTINAEGEGRYFDSKAEAIAAVRTLQARGVQSIDVGCAQVNLMHHPSAFASLDQAFDPQTNVNYAARFLAQLHDQTQDWPKAAALYHSNTPDIGADYQRRVLAVWPDERSKSGEAQRQRIGRLWAQTHGMVGEPADAVPGAPVHRDRVAVMLPVNRLEPVRMLGGATMDPEEIAHRWAVAHGTATDDPPVRVRRPAAKPVAAGGPAATTDKADRKS